VARRPVIGQQLIANVHRLVRGGKGAFAMEESTPTCNTPFAGAGIPQTEEARWAYREWIVTTSGLGGSTSGTILYDETIRQQMFVLAFRLRGSSLAFFGGGRPVAP
jgi:fructose-bisphosphate aldolase class 1